MQAVRFLILSSLIICSAILSLMVRPTLAESVSPSGVRDRGALRRQDDGWRRAAQGWQRTSSWQAPPVATSLLNTSTADVHPAVPFVLILCGVLGGIGLLLVEIDPVEYDAFRLKSCR